MRPDGRDAGGRDARQAPANTGSYFPVQFSTSDCPLAFLYQHPRASPEGDVDQKVVELRCAGNCLEAAAGSPTVAWELVRVRKDRQHDLQARRYFGNDLRVAELTWLNYVDPFPAEQLWAGPSLDYFAQPKAGIYRAQTAFTSFVKTGRIAAMGPLRWVVDWGVGKGQDLGRYLAAGVGNLVGVDRDRAALAELVRRKYSHAQKGAPGAGFGGRPARRAAGQAGTVVHVLAADLTRPFAETVGALKTLGVPVGGGVDACVANLCVHYFMQSTEAMANFVALCRETVKVRGRVAITAMLGERVHALFAAEGVGEGEAWSSRQEGVLKYSLKRLYTSDELQPAGQMIGVLLPFSDGAWYNEYLVNVRALSAEFVRRGFRAEPVAPFDQHFEEFRTREQPLYALLTAEDKKYLSLYAEFGFVRER